MAQGKGVEKMKCFWVEMKRECPYLEQLNFSPTASIHKKDMPMLEHFSIEEVCKNCLMAIYITMKGRIEYEGKV